MLSFRNKKSGKTEVLRDTKKLKVNFKLTTSPNRHTGYLHHITKDFVQIDNTWVPIQLIEGIGVESAATRAYGRRKMGGILMLILGAVTLTGAATLDYDQPTDIEHDVAVSTGIVLVLVGVGSTVTGILLLTDGKEGNVNINPGLGKNEFPILVKRGKAPTGSYKSTKFWTIETVPAKPAKR